MNCISNDPEIRASADRATDWDRQKKENELTWTELRKIPRNKKLPLHRIVAADPSCRQYEDDQPMHVIKGRTKNAKRNSLTNQLSSSTEGISGGTNSL